MNIKLIFKKIRPISPGNAGHSAIK